MFNNPLGQDSSWSIIPYNPTSKGRDAKGEWLLKSFTQKTSQLVKYNTKQLSFTSLLDKHDHIFNSIASNSLKWFSVKFYSEIHQNFRTIDSQTNCSWVEYTLIDFGND